MSPNCDIGIAVPALQLGLNFAAEIPHLREAAKRATCLSSLAGLSLAREIFACFTGQLSQCQLSASRFSPLPCPYPTQGSSHRSKR